MTEKIKALTGNHGDFSGIVLKAAASGNAAAIRHYLTVNPDWLNQEGPHGRTMLWEAAYKGRTELVAELIELGADVNPLGSYYTPMFVELSAVAVARLAGRKELVSLLEANGASDDLFAACHRGDLVAMVQFLDADPKAVDRPARECDSPGRMGWHPIHYAVVGGHFDAVKLLVERGADIGPHLELLVDWGEHSPKIVKYVTQRAAEEGFELPNPVAEEPEVDRPDQWGFPALVDACRGNHNAQDDPVRVQNILDQGANVNITDHKGKTPLHRAGQAGFVEITNLLLDRGADCEIPDNSHATPLFDAVEYGRDAVARLLLDHGANIEHEDERGETPLFIACRKGHVEVARVLLTAGANIMHRNTKGKMASEVIKLSGPKQTEKAEILDLLKERT